jgi:capsular polysaccharide biosynthesis protein
MRILSVKDGIPITYNDSETNIETIFALHDDNTIQQYFTFNLHITPDNTIFQNTLTNSTSNTIIERGYLFYSFRYQISFAHFMMQTVPLLKEYILTYHDYKLLIPEHHYNNLCKDILNLCNISSDRIVLLEDRQIYTITTLAPRFVYHAVPVMYTQDHIWIYSYIRQSLPIQSGNTPMRKVYLKRDGITNHAFGNSETGICRRITNEDELIKILESQGFEIITLGTKHILEKCQSLNNIHILITQIGANCMNLIFGNAPSHCIFLSNNTPLGQSYYTKLSSELNNKNINEILLEFPPNNIYTDPSNSMNSSFEVSIEQILTSIQTLV